MPPSHQNTKFHQYTSKECLWCLFGPASAGWSFGGEKNFFQLKCSILNMTSFFSHYLIRTAAFTFCAALDKVKRAQLFAC